MSTSVEVGFYLRKNSLMREDHAVETLDSHLLAEPLVDPISVKDMALNIKKAEETDGAMEHRGS